MIFTHSVCEAGLTKPIITWEMCLICNIERQYKTFYSSGGKAYQLARAKKLHQRFKKGLEVGFFFFFLTFCLIIDPHELARKKS